MSDDVRAYQKALAELLAALPHCERLKHNGSMCFATATRESFTGHGFHAEYLCDEHGNGEDGLFWDDAVRKAQALMALPEEPAPPTCTPREVLKSLKGDGVQSVRVTNDGMGAGVVEVDMGPHIGTRHIPIDGTETTVELAEKIRSVLPKEWSVGVVR